MRKNLRRAMKAILLGITMIIMLSACGSGNFRGRWEGGWDDLYFGSGGRLYEWWYNWQTGELDMERAGSVARWSTSRGRLTITFSPGDEYEFTYNFLDRDTVILTHQSHGNQTLRRVR